MDNGFISNVIEHYAGVWGAHSYEARWKNGPIHEMLDSFRVLIFEPGPDRPLWVYATCGMSGESEESPVELHLYSPAEYIGHIELLTVVAHYHQTGHPLNAIGSTVNFGRSWMPQSKLTHGLISRPYREGPSLECLRDIRGKTCVSFLWLLPITKEERDFKKQFGLEALEALFDQNGLQYADPSRPSLVA